MPLNLLPKIFARISNLRLHRIATFLICIAMTPVLAFGCSKSDTVGSFDQFEICLGSFSRSKIGQGTKLYKAQNEKLVVELTVKNHNKSEKLEIFVCQDSDCTIKDNNYEIFFLVPWYKDGNSRKSVFHDNRKKRYLEYELMTKDPDLLKLDNKRMTNLIRGKAFGNDKYISSDEFETIQQSDKNGRVTHDANTFFITDTVPSKEIAVADRQIFYVFEKVTRRNNELRIAFKQQNGKKHILKLPISIMPFNLTPPDVDTGIYYRALFNTKQPTLSSERKTKKQLEVEFADMVEKGIRYPTVYLYNDYHSYMATRNKFVFPKDKLFIIDSILIGYLKNGDWDRYQRRLEDIKNDPVFKDYHKLYFYLFDEPDRDKYEQIVGHALPILKENDVGMFLAGKIENFQHHIIDGAVYVLAYEPSATVAASFHRRNARVYSYANPQVGVFKPEALRLNYGFKIVANNYDGIMPYAYQDSFGSQWSDLDSIYRDHMLTYPTSDGLLNTVHGLALQSAITDLRYAATYNHTLENYKLQCGKAYHDPISFKDANKSGPDFMRLRIATEIVKVNQLIEKCRNENH